MLCCCDQVVLYLGIDGSVEGEGKDRHLVGLPPAQLALAKAVLAASPSKPVVVVLINGGQLSIDWLKDNAPAIIEAWCKPPITKPPIPDDLMI